MPYVERILQNRSKVQPPLPVEPRAQAKKSIRHVDNKVRKQAATAKLQREATKNVRFTTDINDNYL